MPSGLITEEMYVERLGRTLTGARLAQVGAFIADASALVRRIAKGELDGADSATVSPELIPVVFNMVRRGIENPRGLTSERIGDYQWAGAGQAIYATDDEVALIRSAAGLGSIGTVELTSDMPERLLMDTTLAPGLTGFEESDL